MKVWAIVDNRMPDHLSDTFFSTKEGAEEAVVKGTRIVAGTIRWGTFFPERRG